MSRLILLLLFTPLLSAQSCDLNGDGVVNVLDLQLMANVITGIAPCPPAVAAPAGVTVSVIGTTGTRTVIGTEPELQFIVGTGIKYVFSADSVNNRINVTVALDTAYINGMSAVAVDNAKLAISLDADGLTYGATPKSIKPATYVPWTSFTFIPAGASCNNNPTLNLWALGALPIMKVSASGLVPLVSGDCIKGMPYTVIAYAPTGTVTAWVLK